MEDKMKKLTDRPFNDFDEDNPDLEFWTDGIRVFNRFSELRGADLQTFEYSGIFAKDARRCYCGDALLQDADPATFKILNNTYAADSCSVYTITGRVAGADISSFEVLDDGKALLWLNKKGIPEYTFCGYARDRNFVYYHNFESRPKSVKKADPQSFVSLNDGYFAVDSNFVFADGRVLRTADVHSWKKISPIPNSLYTKDCRKIFYAFREIEDADYCSFRLIVPDGARYIKYQLAEDSNGFYRNGSRISEDELEKYSDALKKTSPL